MGKIKKKDQEQTAPRKMERTGLKTFNVKHDDGSIFECKVDDTRRFDSMPGSTGFGRKSIAVNGFNTKKKPLICDGCKKRVYKIRIANGTALCNRCS